MNFKKLIKHTSFIILLSLVTGICTNIPFVKRYLRGDYQKGFVSLEEYSSITYITLPEAEELFSRGDIRFIDSRPAGLFRTGRIFGAVNVPYEEKETINQYQLSKEQTLVIYCDGDECQSSINLAKFLHELGYSDIKVFFGGWAEWEKAGLPVSTEDDR